MSAAADPAGKPVPSAQGNDRRQLIIDATLEMIGERGVRGTSHRRVAKAAGVPLSTTSYYFGTLDNLLEEAFTNAI
jgi:DNA-binding transcriptional regulator YbjK